MNTIHVYFEHLGDRVTLSRPGRLKKSRTLSEIVGSFPPACTHTPLCVRGRAGDRNSKTEKERVCETELGVKGAGGAIPMRTKERIWVCSWKSKERTNAPRRAREQAKQTKPAGVWVGGGGRCGGRGAVAISIRSRSPNSLLLCVHVCV